MPSHPLLQKGALVAYKTDAPGTTPSVIPFQYNPESVNRTIKREAGTGERSSPQDALRVGGPPGESISMTVRIDASDMKARSGGSGAIEEYGVLPALYLLETLLYPDSTEFEEARQKAAQGEIAPFALDLPLTLLVFGPNRVVPVKLTGVTVDEAMHDTHLNPLSATVALTMEVMDSRELNSDGIGRSAFTSHLRQKERLARKTLVQGGTAYVDGVLP